MEELADAIEDAQYVNAISTQDNGPRPVLPWDKPSDEQLAAWEETVTTKQLSYISTAKEKLGQSTNSTINKEPDGLRSPKTNSIPHRDGGLHEAFTLEWVCAQPIGYFLFSQYVKEVHKDYMRINFCEETLRFRNTRGRRNRLERALLIGQSYIINPVGDDSDEPDVTSRADGNTPESNTEQSTSVKKKLPASTEIVEYDLCRKLTVVDNLTPQETKQMCTVNLDHPTCSESIIGLKGPIRKTIIQRFFDLQGIFPDIVSPNSKSEGGTDNNEQNRQEQSIEKMKIDSNKRSPPPKTTSSLIDDSDDLTEDPSFTPASTSATGRSVSMYGTAAEMSNKNVISMMNQIQNTDTNIAHDEMEQLAAAPAPSLAAQVSTNDFPPMPSPTKTASRSQSVVVEKTPSSATSQLTNVEISRTMDRLCEYVRSKRFSSAIFHSSSKNSVDISTLISVDMFDEAELVIIESLKNDYWESFQGSTYYKKLKNFLWFKDRKVVPDDFLTMRVLGRGGFGLVYGTFK
jgi:hypothetical protein